MNFWKVVGHASGSAAVAGPGAPQPPERPPPEENHDGSSHEREGGVAGGTTAMEFACGLVAGTAFGCRMMFTLAVAEFAN
jgi:hypothetical protein